MYTEDDEEVKIKKKDSDNDYNDFYTAFNQLDEKEDKKNSKKKSKKVEKEKKVEDDYGDFYGYENEEEVKENNNNRNKAVLKFAIIIILVIVLAILSVFLFRKCDREPGDIELNKTSYELEIGKQDYITYKVINTESNVTSTFTSSNPNVVTVDEFGSLTAVGPGDAIIVISYTINGKTREKECTVKVNGPEIKHELSLNLKASTTNWTNKDVTITVTPKTDTSITSLKYAINCTSNCNYMDVTNNQIVISNIGVTKVVVIAKDSSNLEVTKEITTKIDKEAPTVTYTGGSTVKSNKEVSVCATCTDSLSGCKQAKVCKKYTSSKSNQVITVTDNAGNSKSSQSFNVVIEKKEPPCTLKVSSDGTVSATLKESATYYGFNSNLTGNNELSKSFKDSITSAKVIYYYVRLKNGSAGSCYITVIKECNNSSCTFRAN